MQAVYQIKSSIDNVQKMIDFEYAQFGDYNVYFNNCQTFVQKLKARFRAEGVVINPRPPGFPQADRLAAAPPDKISIAGYQPREEDLVSFEAPYTPCPGSVQEVILLG